MDNLENLAQTDMQEVRDTITHEQIKTCIQF